MYLSSFPRAIKLRELFEHVSTEQLYIVSALTDTVAGPGSRQVQMSHSWSQSRASAASGLVLASPSQPGHPSSSSQINFVFLNSLLVTACHLTSSSLLDPMTNMVFLKGPCHASSNTLVPDTSWFLAFPLQSLGCLGCISVVSVVPGIEPETSYVLGKHFSTDLFP